jgi:2-octaprenyl-6-methoxyphenol hydroxylase
MPAADERLDVIIAGGGMVGLALGCALQDALGTSAKIAVVDPAPAGGVARDLRASALSAGSQHLLAALGVWPALAEHAQPVTGVDITDASLEDVFRPILVSYDNTVGDGEPATYIIENERLARAVTAGAQQRPALRLVSAAVASHAADEHGVTVTLGNGERLRAALLVAADGRASRVREAAGIDVVGWKYPQVGIVTTVEHEKPHRARAVQHFLPSGPFAILPLKGNRACITWTEDDNEGRRIVALEDADFLTEAEKRFGYRLGRITLAGPRALWPLEMHLARALAGDRVVLVGDAAHLVHPIAGQGLNLGLRDVAALTEVVTDAARLGLDIGSSIVLGRYERWRRTDSALSAAAFDALNRLFSSDWTLLRTARSAGLAIVDRLPVLKQFFVAEAAGLTGEVPKLLRGEAV